MSHPKPVSDRASEIFALLAGGSTLVLLGSFVPAAWGAAELRWLLRILAMVSLLATAYVLIYRPCRLLLISPLFGLGGLALVFFAWIPALYVTVIFDPSIYPFDLFADGKYLPVRNGVAVPHSLGVTVPFVGSAAERLILQVGLCCTIVTQLLAVAAESGRLPVRASADTELKASTFYVILMAGLVACVATPLLAQIIPGKGVPDLYRKIAREMYDIAPVIAVTALVLLAYLVQPASLRRFSGFVLLGLAALVCLGAFETKRSIIGIGIAVAIVALRGAIPASWRRALFISLLIVPLVGLASAMVVRGHLPATGSDQPSASAFIRNLAFFATMKGVFRQGESGYCLQAVIDRHIDDGVPDEPLYFFKALVPRALWPEKPSFSRGDEYARAYCEYGPLNPGAAHSASVTLLGEPIIRGGLAGLLSAIGILLPGLGLLSALILRGSWLSRAAIAALTPWLTDIDQSFALYVAVALKTILLIAPLLLLAAVLQRTSGQEK